MKLYFEKEPHMLFTYKYKLWDLKLDVMTPVFDNL